MVFYPPPKTRGTVEPAKVGGVTWPPRLQKHLGTWWFNRGGRKRSGGSFADAGAQRQEGALGSEKPAEATVVARWGGGGRNGRHLHGLPVLEQGCSVPRGHVGGRKLGEPEQHGEKAGCLRDTESQPWEARALSQERAQRSAKEPLLVSQALHPYKAITRPPA